MVTAQSSNTSLSPYSLVSQTPHTIVQSPHPYTPTHGQSLRFSCQAAEGVTEECTLQVLLLTSPGQMERKILLLEHVNYFAINRFSPSITGMYIMVSIKE